MRCHILWSTAGPLGIQPLLSVSIDDGRSDEDEALAAIRDLIRSRRPKPIKCDVWGGNVEPGVFCEANEMHFGEGEPRIVKWLRKRLASDLGYDQIEVTHHVPRRGAP
jgi:hypothetical protein